LPRRRRGTSFAASAKEMRVSAALSIKCHPFRGGDNEGTPPALHPGANLAPSGEIPETTRTIHPCLAPMRTTKTEVLDVE
jgi:hypothetical protein